MKRIVSLLLICIVSLCGLCVSASASEYDRAAQELSKIGILRGTTDGNFNLDSVPTRGQVAILLTRLYGAESEAASAYADGTTQSPFDDVTGTVASSVAWLYQKGVVNGVSATSFGAAQPCSLQNYVVFLLRALGYQDGKDFQYADALNFAAEKGFYNPLMFSGTFLRDDLAALTYQALAADTADGTTYLLNRLVQSGAVDSAAAKPLMEKMETYRTLETAVNELNSQNVDMDMDMKMDMTITADGSDPVKDQTETVGHVKMLLGKEDTDIPELAYELTTSAMGENVQLGMWIKDGWYYVSMDDGEGEQVHFKYSLKEIGLSDLLETVEPLKNLQAVNVNGLAMVDDLNVQTEKNGQSVYTMKIGSGMAGMLSGIRDLMGEESGMSSMQIGTITAMYTLDTSGKLQSVRMVFSAGLSMMMALEEDAQEVPTDFAYDYDMMMTIRSVGEQVQIVYPDFSDFQEVTSEMLSGFSA